MQPLQFTLAILVLLATPGPTNTLLWLSGAAVGARRSLGLLLAELGGYFTVVVPVATLAAPFIAAHPVAGTIVKLAAACWVFLMARALWIGATEQEVDGRPVTFGQVFFTTLLNPKGLIVALAIMPQVGPLAMLPWLAGFATLTLCAGSLWIFAGSLVARLPGQAVGSRLPRRIAAVCLVVFSFGMASSALASLI